MKKKSAVSHRDLELRNKKSCLIFALTSFIVISVNVKTDAKAILENLISQNNGRITSKEVDNAGIHRMYLKQLTDEGKLVQVERGIYQDSETLEDELYNIQTRYPTAIYSFETALYLHSLLERAPFNWTFTVKGTYHSKTLDNSGYSVKHSSEKLYSLEIVEVKSPAGNIIKAYSAERTICEILTTKAATDIQVITYAVKTYANRKDKNIPKLLELSKTFHVETKLRPYLEVLL